MVTSAVPSTVSVSLEMLYAADAECTLTVKKIVMEVATIINFILKDF